MGRADCRRIFNAMRQIAGETKCLAAGQSGTVSRAYPHIGVSFPTTVFLL